MSEAKGNWTEEELRASVCAYVEMLGLEAQEEPYTKSHYYTKLSKQFGRTTKAFEFRMQNISYVYSAMGRQWLKGLKPAKNVGANVGKKLEALIFEIEGQVLPTDVAFDISVHAKVLGKPMAKPKGVKRPKRKKVESTQYDRDPDVVAWVLQNSKGVCESCGSKAPFDKEGGIFYLEVHHLRGLADGGSDTVYNAAAVCPNCHREFHYGAKKLEKLDEIFGRIKRLRRE